MIEKFNQELKHLQSNYKGLQTKSNVEATNRVLRDSIIEKTIQRDNMRQECTEMDFKCQDKSRELNRLKEQHN